MSVRKVTHVSKEDYSWGSLRRLRAGNSITVVLHPAAWSEILESVLGDGMCTTVMTEDGVRWLVRPMADGGLRFEARARGKLAVAQVQVQDLF